jgi:hypothetical protein
VGEHLVEQIEAALALEALKKGGEADIGVMQVGELLEEVATALEDAQTAADPSFHPSGIIERGAVPAVFGSGQKLEKRLENSLQMIELQ